tara:strand:- start:1033 stop:1209 length:177 start_codon:yes stop_codon:yes gene_type:complete
VAEGGEQHLESMSVFVLYVAVFVANDVVRPEYPYFKVFWGLLVELQMLGVAERGQIQT